jgi:2-iminobutanoate/2-iminopropanoate deaminase
MTRAGATTDDRRKLRPAAWARGAMDDERAFSYGLQVGRMVWVSGTTARDDRGEVVGQGDMEAQAQKCLENIETILREAGGTRDDIVKLTVYLADRVYRDRFQQVRKRFFKPPYPASAMVIGTMVLPEYLVEIDAVAVLRDGGKDAS